MRLRYIIELNTVAAFSIHFRLALALVYDVAKMQRRNQLTSID